MRAIEAKVTFRPAELIMDYFNYRKSTGDSCCNAIEAFTVDNEFLPSQFGRGRSLRGRILCDAESDNILN